MISETYRILLVSSEFPPGPGGIGTHAYELADNLTRLGWAVFVLAGQDYVDDRQREHFNARLAFPIETFRSESIFPLKVLSRATVTINSILRYNPDIIITSGKRIGMLVWGVTRLYRCPYMVVGHGTEFGTKSRWERFLLRRTLRSAAMIAAVSKYTWRQIETIAKCTLRGTVIPNGANSEKFRVLSDSEKSQFIQENFSGDDYRLLTVGNVSERKGQEVVIRALPAILREVPNVRYVMVGLPTIQAKLAAIAEELGVFDRIDFVGKIDDEKLVGYMNRCDLFVMTSVRTDEGDFEGFGIAVVEAALCGTPAVVSNDSGLMEAIVAGETGIGVPENNPEATAKAIISLLNDRDKRMKMGLAARDRALAEQTWRHRAKDYDKLLRGIVERGRESRES